MNLLNAQQKKKNEATKAKQEGRRKSEKKSQNSKFCFLRMSELCKLIFCIWIRRRPTVGPETDFMVSFTATRKQLDRLQDAFFRKNSRGRMG